MAVRGQFVGNVVAVYQRNGWEQGRRDGSVRSIPPQHVLILATGYGEPPQRVFVTEAQANQLGDPSLQFTPVVISGEVDRDPAGYGQVIVCASFSLHRDAA